MPASGFTSAELFEKNENTEKRYMYPMFITALFSIAKIWKQPKCQSKEKWIKYKYLCIFEVKVKMLGTQLCTTRCKYMYHSPPSSVMGGHGRTRLLCPWDSPARILEWVGMPSFRESSWPMDVSNRRLLHWQVYSLPLSHLGSPPPNVELVWFFNNQFPVPVYSYNLPPHISPSCP